MENLRALILDDEEELTFLLSSVLEFNRFKVHSVSRPKEAISLLEKEKFDLLITDFKMDEMDGFEVIDKVRSHLGLGDLKVIMLTFRDFNDDEHRRLSADNVVYLKKPFLPNELIQKIESLFL